MTFLLHLDIIMIIIQGGPKEVTPTFRLIAQRFVIYYNSYLVNRMLLSTIRGSNSQNLDVGSFLTTPF